MHKHLILILTVILTVLILAFISAFLSASETALVGLSRIRLRSLIAKGDKKAVIVGALVKNIDKLITTILISNNFVNISISSIATAVSIYYFGPRLGVALATIAVTIFILIFCEITPKIFASSRSVKVSLSVGEPMKWIVEIFSPLSSLLSKFSKKIIFFFSGESPKRAPFITEEEIKLMIEIGKEEGILAEKEREMLHRIFKFGDTKVFEVMIPKEKITALDINADAEDLVLLLINESYSRIPVYDGSLNKIAGIIYAKDLIAVQKTAGTAKVRDLLHTPFFCSPEIRVIDLMRDFQKRHIHMAIVKEGEETKGLVTLEDLLEEIVGEIEDEFEGEAVQK